MSPQKDSGLLGSLLATVSALQHFSNEKMMSLLVKGSDQHSQRLMAKQLDKPDFSIVWEPYSRQPPRGTLLTVPSQPGNMPLVVTSVAKNISQNVEDAQRVLQARKGGGRLEETPPRTARGFSHLLLTPSLSPRIPKGCQLINSSLSTCVASNNMPGASRDSNPGPLER